MVQLLTALVTALVTGAVALAAVIIKGRVDASARRDDDRRDDRERRRAAYTNYLEIANSVPALIRKGLFEGGPRYSQLVLDDLLGDRLIKAEVALELVRPGRAVSEQLEIVRSRFSAMTPMSPPVPGKGVFELIDADFDPVRLELSKLAVVMAEELQPDRATP